MKLDAKLAFTLIVAVILSACAGGAKRDHVDQESFTTQQLNACNEQNQTGRNIAVFLDGTANTQNSDTNVRRLYDLAVEQNDGKACPSNYAIYIQGVGTEGGAIKKVAGLISGRGIGADVRQGYAFIAKNYRDERDKIYIFGFSRGSAASRVLASFIAHAGLVKIEQAESDHAKSLVKKLYGKYKTNLAYQDKVDSIALLLSRETRGQEVSRKADVEFMGIWDTVAALGVFHFGESSKNAQLNSKYSDQLCNVRRVAHALSVDDNRAKTFTPALLTRELLNNCKKKQATFPDFIDEVWFSGAHSDVGGGYDDSDLGSVSLAWMIERVQAHDQHKLSCGNRQNNTPLFQSDVSVQPKPLQDAHDAAEHFLGGFSGQNRNRNIPSYLAYGGCKDANNLFCTTSSVPVIHESVRLRLSRKRPLSRDFDWTANPKNKKHAKNYPACFTQSEHIPMDDRHHDYANCSIKTHYYIDLIENKKGCPVVWKPRERVCEP